MINFTLSSFTYGHLVLKPGYPEDLSSLVVPGSEVHSATGDYGKFLFQEIHAGDITLLYNVYRANEDIAIDFRCNQCNLRAHVALKNDSLYYLAGVGDFYLAEGQFNIADSPATEGTYFLERGQEYRTLHIMFSPEFFNRLPPVFYYLNEWFASDQPRPRILFKIHSWLNPELKEIINKILHCTYTGELLDFYRDLKTREWLCLALTPHNGQAAHTVKLTRHNIEMIRESKHILDNGMGRHLTITSIAEEIGMNEFKLKVGFKQVFGISMFDYLIKIRMQAAKNLLLETDKPIKEIATLTGYSTKQSFLNAFKKYFHDTPGSFRKN